MNDMMHYGWAGAKKLREEYERLSSFDGGGGYSIANCCGARHYDNVDQFNNHNKGVQTMINPSKELKTGNGFKLEKLQLGKDVLVIKLRGVE